MLDCHSVVDLFAWGNDTMTIPSTKGPINQKKSLISEELDGRAICLIHSNNFLYLFKEDFIHPMGRKMPLTLQVHMRLGLAAIFLCGSSWHSQPCYWLMLRVAWLDLHWNFSRGQPGSEVLKFCHFWSFEWPSGLGIRNGLPGQWFYKEGTAVACTAKLHRAEYLVCSIELCCFHKVKWWWA